MKLYLGFSNRLRLLVAGFTGPVNASLFAFTRKTASRGPQ
jgi:hypothetical protein